MLGVEPAAEGFSARFAAKSRAYRYRVLRRRVRSPFADRRALWWPRPLDLDALEAAAALIPGKHDFTAFTPTETQHRLFTRTVLSAAWEDHGEELHFTIAAESFLRHMVRTLVGTMLEGRELAPLLAGRPRAEAGMTAHRAVDRRLQGNVLERCRPQRRAAASSVASIPSGMNAPCVLASLLSARAARNIPEHMRFPVVLFDFDGTVIDSGSIIIASMRHATKTVLGRDIPDEELGRAVGGSGLIEQMRLIDPDRVDELVACYREHNEPLHAELAECAGMTDVLTTLKAEGRRLGVVTAKRRETVRLAFSYLPLEQFFDVVVGSDDTDRHKPDPAPLEHALGLLDAGRDEAVYVGDSPFDIRAAKGAGMHSIAVTWGGIHPRERLEAEEPDAVVASAEELLAAL